MKEGTVGLPLPGVSAKIVDLETGEDLGPNKSGMLLVSGPNVMKGYYGRPDLTAEVIREKGDITDYGGLGNSSCASKRKSVTVPFSRWYVTGDVAVIDDDGFITITGRISRFSKLAGEMVPHIRVEEAIAQALGLGEDDLKFVVTAVARREEGRAARGALHRTGADAREDLPRVGRRRSAAALDPLARQFPPRRGHSRPRHRQARSQAGQGPGDRGIPKRGHH